MRLQMVSLLLAGVALAGCGAAPAVSPPAPAQATAPATAAAPAPVAVSIPAVGVESSLEPYGLNPDGTMAVPPIDEPGQASWFEPGVRPGEIGPAVIAGHVSGRVAGAPVPGVFARLHELAPGDDVWIDRADGTRLRFVVNRVEQHPKNAFPTEEVYGDRPGPELVLVTCGGVLGTADDDGTRSYQSNTLVFALLVEQVAP